MKRLGNIKKRRPLRAWVVGGCVLVWAAAGARASDDYGARMFDGSSYVQHGPGPAYGGGYSDYGGNASGLEGRFSASYGEFGAVPGYGRFGSGSDFGTGPLRGVGTGQGRQATEDYEGRNHARAKEAAPQKPAASLPF